MKFEDMDIWKRSARLTSELYKHFIDSKDYGFKDQITRSALSIPSNIAEGMERNSDKDLKRFLQYSKGSCGELRTQIYIGMDIGYIKKDKGSLWIKETKELSLMIGAFIRKLKKRIEN